MKFFKNPTDQLGKKTLNEVGAFGLSNLEPKNEVTISKNKKKTLSKNAPFLVKTPHDTWTLDRPQVVLVDICFY